MIWTVLDYCKNCNHSVHTHIGPFGRDGDKFGYFKIAVWGSCSFPIGYGSCCGCNKFSPKDNLEYLEYKYEQA